MPYAPTVNDMSGQILGQGILAAGQSIATGIKDSVEANKRAKEQAKLDLEQREKLLSIATALGIEGADHMSTGELSGAVDGAAIQHARKLEDNRSAMDERRLRIDEAGNARADQYQNDQQTSTELARRNNELAVQAVTGAGSIPGMLRRPDASQQIYRGAGGQDFDTLLKLNSMDRAAVPKGKPGLIDLGNGFFAATDGDKTQYFQKATPPKDEVNYIPDPNHPGQFMVSSKFRPASSGADKAGKPLGMDDFMLFQMVSPRVAELRKKAPKDLTPDERNELTLGDALTKNLMGRATGATTAGPASGGKAPKGEAGANPTEDFFNKRKPAPGLKDDGSIIAPAAPEAPYQWTGDNILTRILTGNLF